MSYERTEAKLRALVAQREAEQHRDCPAPGCRLAEGHAGLHCFPPEVDRLRSALASSEERLREALAAKEAAEKEVRDLESRLDEANDLARDRGTDLAASRSREAGLAGAVRDHAEALRRATEQARRDDRCSPGFAEQLLSFANGLATLDGDAVVRARAAPGDGEQGTGEPPRCVTCGKIECVGADNPDLCRLEPAPPPSGEGTNEGRDG